MIEAKIITDSINKYSSRLTTFKLVYPRFIHQELLTHRMLSRNSASSRAIPVEKMIKWVIEEPAMPVYWGANQKGMQATRELQEDESALAKSVWLNAMEKAVASARELLKLNLHKQIANRLLEPFAHMTTIITATDLSNLFNLRCHKDAQPEFKELAFKMLEAYENSSPNWKGDGGLHLPFGDNYLSEGISQGNLIKICVARCARVSYLNFEGDIDHEKDYALHDSLLESGHMSPFEHVAWVVPENAQPLSNFKGGWFQYRKKFQNENRIVLDSKKLLAEYYGNKS